MPTTHKKKPTNFLLVCLLALGIAALLCLVSGKGVVATDPRNLKNLQPLEQEEQTKSGGGDISSLSVVQATRDDSGDRRAQGEEVKAMNLDHGGGVYDLDVFAKGLKGRWQRERHLQRYGGPTPAPTPAPVHYSYF